MAMNTRNIGGIAATAIGLVLTKWERVFNIVSAPDTISGVVKMFSEASTINLVGWVIAVVGIVVLWHTNKPWLAGVMSGRFGRTGLSPDRIPILELRDTASDLGWEFKGESLHPLDFAYGLRQAGIDGAFKFWGRSTVSGLPPDHLPLKEIKSSHWEEHEIDGTCFIGKRDNTEVCAHKPADTAEMLFDIYVERRKGLRWLKADAENYKGRRARVEAERD